MRTCAEIEADISTNSDLLGEAYDDLDTLSLQIENLEQQAEDLFQEWLDGECGSSSAMASADVTTTEEELQGRCTKLEYSLLRLQRAMIRLQKRLKTSQQ